eukprot:10275173-Heterocapsa_arctica.AAC.1
MPNVNLQEHYDPNEPVRRAAPAVRPRLEQPGYRDYVDPRNTLMGSLQAPYFEQQLPQAGYATSIRSRTASPMTPVPPPPRPPPSRPPSPHA